MKELCTVHKQKLTGSYTLPGPLTYQISPMFINLLLISAGYGNAVHLCSQGKLDDAKSNRELFIRKINKVDQFIDSLQISCTKQYI